MPTSISELIHQGHHQSRAIKEVWTSRPSCINLVALNLLRAGRKPRRCRASRQSHRHGNPGAAEEFLNAAIAFGEEPSNIPVNQADLPPFKCCEMLAA